MCGIFGITTNQSHWVSPVRFGRIFKALFTLSESRGKEASGFAFLDNGVVKVYKTPFSASRLVKSGVYKQEINHLIKHNQGSMTAIGHSRLVTSGHERFSENNQPVIKSGLVGLHNGIVVNEKELWEKYGDEERLSRLDSELILTLLRRFYRERGSWKAALGDTFGEIRGMTSVALLFEELNNLLLATNNGSLYFVVGDDRRFLVFASEYYILETMLKKWFSARRAGASRIRKLKPGRACLFNLDTIDFHETSIERALENQEFQTMGTRSEKWIIRDLSEKHAAAPGEKRRENRRPRASIPRRFIRHYHENEKKINVLKRCSRCLLPETFPFIAFDRHGVCNYCEKYQSPVLEGVERLEQAVAPYRGDDGKPDCIVAFSGGRDSSYGLHHIREVLKMNPIAYSYDWGMITDLARRNQARLCGKLGVEHILISADIRAKRSNIRKNVLAWLKRPRLGAVPLFMAGDKQYFYYANKLMKQNNIQLVVLCENMLETTRFKSGFCGVKPEFTFKNTYSLSLRGKITMASFYAGEYARNRAYLNSSMIDTAGAFLSYYCIPHDYLNIYNYIQWDEPVIDRVLRDEYDWERSPDTKSTWRIGDGTAAFYNYIYYTAAGFSENDTFRSNQIREGLMNREEALNAAREENRPRFESIQWYCDVIGVDFNRAIDAINAIPKLYDR